MSKYSIKHNLIIEKHRKTSLKLRYRVDNKSLLRVNEITSHPISLETEKIIISKFKKIASKLDLVIFSDFNYGLLTNSLISKIIDICNKYKIFITADCQSSSQIGDITKYKYVNLLTPTEQELRVGLKNNIDNITRLADIFLKTTHNKNLILKLGKNGVIINKLISNDNLLSKELKPLTKNFIDVMGAGDALLSITSLAMANGLDIWSSSLLGQTASAVQVNTKGNIPLNLKEISENLKYIFNKTFI